MPTRFKVYEEGYPHFITSSILYWIPIFRRDDYFRILTDSLTYCSQNKGLQIHAYVIMPDHFHAICSCPSGRFSDVLRDMKKHTSKQLGAKLLEDGRQLWLKPMQKAADIPGGVKVWEDEFHPEQIYSETFFMQKLDYVHQNPIKAGFVTDPCHWKYSSAGFYYLQTESTVPIVPIEW